MSHNYLRRMLDMLTGAYNRNDMRAADKGEPPATNIGRLFATLAWGLELVHGSAETIRLWDDIDKATGKTLDRYGANFGVARQGTADPFYRLLIRVKMIALLSGGDVDTVINAVAALYDIDPSGVELRELFPAKVRLVINDDLLDDDRREVAPHIVRITKRIVAAGIWLDMEFRRYRPTEMRLGIAAYAVVSERISATPAENSRIDDPTLRLGATTHTIASVTIRGEPPSKGNLRRAGQLYCGIASTQLVHIIARPRKED